MLPWQPLRTLAGSDDRWPSLTFTKRMTSIQQVQTGEQARSSRPGPAGSGVSSTLNWTRVSFKAV